MTNDEVVTKIKDSLTHTIQWGPLYMSVPPDAKVPYAVMEVDELWNHDQASLITGVVGKVKFSVHLLGQLCSKSALVEASSRINSGVDGLNLSLSAGGSVMIRHLGHVYETKSDRYSHRHCFDALVWQG